MFIPSKELVRTAKPPVVRDNGLVNWNHEERGSERLSAEYTSMAGRRSVGIGVPSPVLITRRAREAERNCGGKSLSEGRCVTATFKLSPPLVLRT